jgi:hypothetical protein
VNGFLIMAFLPQLHTLLVPVFFGYGHNIYLRRKPPQMRF